MTGILYPLADYIYNPKHLRLRALMTGEKRPPKRGEWYLSGNPVEAYRAPNDLTTSYHIARIVVTRVETKEVIEVEYDPHP